jgi:large subunit ribosomal protein L17
MRHQKKGRVFGRERKVRVALIRSLAEALIEKGKIMTTEAKAKELRPFIERLVTFGKKGTVASRRIIVSRLGGRMKVAALLVSEIAPKYKDRRGGYTRIVKMGVRKADSSKRALIEFV